MHFLHKLLAVLGLILLKLSCAQNGPNVSVVCRKNDPCSCNYAQLIANGSVGTIGATCFSQFVCPYDSKTQKFCSANGECDFRGGECKCSLGFGGSDCGKSFTTFVLNPGIRFSMIGLGVLGAVAGIALIGWTYKYREVREVKAMSVTFTYATLVGCVLICAHAIVIPFGYDNTNCVLIEWFGFSGITLVIGSSLVKSYRIAMIFNKTISSPTDLTDAKLGRYLGVMMVIQTLFLIIYTVLNFVTGGSYIRYVDANLVREPRCNGNLLAVATYGILTLYTAALLVAVIVFGNRTRSAGEIFKETKCIYIGSNVGLMMVITFGIFINFTTQLNWQQMIRGYGSALVVFLVIGLLYKPKFEAVYGLKDDLDENGMSDKDREFKKNFELDTKDRTGRELLSMLEILIGEIAYRKKMNMFHIELHESDAVRIETLMQQVATKIRTTAASENKLTGSRKAQAVESAVGRSLELQESHAAGQKSDA